MSATAIATRRFDQLAGAWNDADGSAFAAPFAADADFVDIRGIHHRGATAIAAGHQAIFDSIYAGSIVDYRVESARTIAPGCVVALVAAELDCPTGPLAGRNRSRLTAVLVADGGEWSITSFHNTLQAAPPT